VNQKPTYVSKPIVMSWEKLIALFHEFKDYFAWDYDDKSGLSRDLVEHRLSVQEGNKTIKQAPQRFAHDIDLKIKEEIERLLNANFICTIMYIHWISKIVIVIKKSGKMCVY